MNRITTEVSSSAERTMEIVYKEIQSRATLSPRGACPIDVTLDFVRLCHSHSCGKCTPCRIGLGTLASLLEDVLNGEADESVIDLIDQTARTIADTADCAIGYECGQAVLKTVDFFRDDFESHIKDGRCLYGLANGIPCSQACPAHVDIPGYIALTGEGRYEEALALIRKDNPFPSVCGNICEHPCEKRCRRNILDDAVNICGIKRFASEHSTEGIAPEKCAPTGKRIAVIGGGPAGLTACYYLALMGHSVTCFEVREKLGGMLRYGIPDYRLPQEILDRDISFIVKQGIDVRTSVNLSEDDILNIKKDYDAVYLAIGAHSDKKLGIEGENSNNVLSAIELLRNTGSGKKLDLSGKRVCVVGGGNVAMDCTRTCIRLGAKTVTCVYRRRIADMTALAEEIEEAQAEGVKMLSLHAPDHIEADKDGNVAALWAQRQIISAIGSDGRPSVRKADNDPVRLECDYVVVAIGQAINSKVFEALGVKTNRGTFVTDKFSHAADNVFAGGDASSGPATVIKAVAAGKVAAANIDRFLGFNHELKTNVEIPKAPLSNTASCGRVNINQKNEESLKGNFDISSYGMSLQECKQECSRCLRCDSFGIGILKGGRKTQW